MQGIKGGLSMEETLTHWKTMHNPNYLGSFCFQPNEEKHLTIKSVGYEEVTGEKGRKENLQVIHFKEKGVLPFIVNKTNAKMISKLSGSPYIEKWANQMITIYVDDKVRFGNDIVEGLRIRPKAPTIEKPILDQNYKGWNNAINALKNGNTTLEIIKSKYRLTPESEQEIQKIIDELGGDKNAKS